MSRALELFFISYLRGLMALNQISLMSFWKINPGRYYRMYVPGFQQTLLHAVSEAKQQPTRSAKQWQNSLQGRGIPGTHWKGLWQYHSMLSSSPHSIRRLLQHLCLSWSERGTCPLAPVPNHTSNDRGNVNKYMPFINLTAHICVNTK